MGAYDIQGKNCLFQLKIDDTYKTVVCAKSFTFNPVTDMKETTTVGSGFWKEYRPRKLSYTITFNGMLQVMSLSNQEQAKTLFQYQLQFLPLDYQLLYTDNTGNQMFIRGRIYVTSSLFDASPVNLVNATQELQGTGPIEVLDELPDPINIHITSTGNSSIPAFVQFKLYDTNNDLVFDSGQLPGASGGNLAHPVDVIGTVQKGSYYYTWTTSANSINNNFSLNAPPTASTPFGNGTSNGNTVGVQLYDFTADRNVVFALGQPTPPATCVPVQIVGSTTLPDGQVGMSYLANLGLSGSQPFTIDNITKPTWLTISIVSGNIIVLTGTPDVDGTDIQVSFRVNNACGSVNFSDTIDIAPAAGDRVTLNNILEIDGPAAGNLRIYHNGDLIRNWIVAQSDSFDINPGDVVEAQVLPVGDALAYLTVDNQTDVTTLFTNGGVNVPISYSWTVVANKSYLITGRFAPNI